MKGGELLEVTGCTAKRSRPSQRPAARARVLRCCRAVTPSRCVSGQTGSVQAQKCSETQAAPSPWCSSACAMLERAASSLPARVLPAPGSPAQLQGSCHTGRRGRDNGAMKHVLKLDTKQAQRFLLNKHTEPKPKNQPGLSGSLCPLIFALSQPTEQPSDGMKLHQTPAPPQHLACISRTAAAGRLLPCVTAPG